MHIQSMLQRFGSESGMKLIRKKISKSFYRANIFRYYFSFLKITYKMQLDAY